MVTRPPSLISDLRDRIAQVMPCGRSGKQPRRWVGLDLGSASIKLAECEQTQTGVRLVKSLVQELPIAPNQETIDRVGWLQSAFKEFDTREVHVALSGSEVAVRRVHIPPMSARELPEAVKWQVKDELPFPVQEAVLDLRVIGEVWEKDLKKQDVLVAAASRSCLHGLMGMVERAGGRVASVTPTPLALWSSVAGLIPDAQQGSVVLIELGASTTHVAIVKDGQVRVVRDLAVGSATMTEALIGETVSDKGKMTIDRSLAEAFKRRYGVLTEAPEGTTEEGVPLFHLASLIRPLLENLLTELSRFLDFYKVQMEQGGISRLLLCGGGANLKQLQPFLAEGLGLPVEVFNPLVRITDRVERMEPEQVAEAGPRLAVAVGAALDHGQGLNLLPARPRAAMLSAVPRRVWIRAAQAVAGTAIALYAGLWLIVGVTEWQLRGQRAAWAQVKPTYTKALSVIARHKALHGSIDQAQQFLEAQPIWEGLFKELGEAMPANLELVEVSLRADAVTSPRSPLRIVLRGRLAPGAGGAPGSISQFVEALEQSIFFERVHLVSSELHTGAGATTFEIEGVLE